MSNSTHYEVLARKYRPQTFSELTGQEHVSRTLQNAIDANRVAHAFLFTGARGVGKTSTARILAKTLNCEKGVTHEPCNVCPLCIEITKGTSTDVFEIDGASNTGVDDIRDLRDTIKYLPSHSRYKIFIIDEVHMLTNNAFNALLKTLEEPPEHVKFIFATTEPHKLPVTILSRCQRFDFKRVSLAKIIARLRDIVDKEGVVASDASLALIARKGDGSMRDSLTALDQVLAFCGNTVNDEDVAALLGTVDRRLLMGISEAVFSADTQAVLEGIRQVDLVGYNMRQFCQELIDHFRNLLVMRSVKRPEELLDLAEAELEELRRQSGGLSVEDVQRRLTLLIRAETEMANATFPRLIVEMALLKCALLAPIVSIQDLMEKIKVLEAGAIHTPDLLWEPRRPSPATDTQKPKEAPARQVLAPPVPPPPNVPGDSYSFWGQFVAHVNEKQPASGSIMEHGSLIKNEAGIMEIGFPQESYYLTAAQDVDFIAEIRNLAKGFQGHDVTVKIVPISPERSGIPMSLAEKKKSDSELRLEGLRQAVETHPVVNEARRVFGGDIADIKAM